MDNYEYIIASLPDIARDPLPVSLDTDDIFSQIRSQLSARDNSMFDFLLKGFRPEELTRDFYTEAAGSPNGFIRDYFEFDRKMRNTRVQWLNARLERPEGQDILTLEDDEDVEADPATLDALAVTDMLGREKAMDELIWDKCSELTELHVFDLDVILNFVVKTRLCQRWLALDYESGKAMLRKMVDEIRKTKQ